MERASGATRVLSVLLDERDRPVEFLDVQHWLNEFFPPRARARLPEEVTGWLKHSRDGTRGGEAHSGFRSLVRERPGQRLRISVISALAQRGRILVLGRESAPPQR